MAHWLKSQGWIILDRRWRCRWGEIDIVALYVEEGHGGQGGQGGDLSSLSPPPPLSSSLPICLSPTLAFVEVKTRSPKNWDAGGRNAIASSKQVKLWRTAQMFLVAHPDKADYPCRFDVAIVSYQEISTQLSGDKFKEKNLVSSYVAGYKLTLQEYITAAFDAVQ